VKKCAPLFRLGAAILFPITLTAVRCGSDFRFQDVTPHTAAPLAATYDIMATYATLAFPEFPATSLALDLTLEIDPNSLDASTGALSGTVTIHDAIVAGLSRTFSPTTSIPVEGRLAGGEIDLTPFGPITVGATILFPDLLGMLSPDGRRIDGVAQLGNLPDTGTWLAVKQRRYLIAATDFSLQGTASIVTVRFGTRFKVDRDVELVSGDPVAAASPGQAFIVNRLLLPMINEAVYTLYEGVGSVEAIDTAMKLGANHPMGPLELADFIGLDTCLSIMQVLYEGLADSKYRPCPLLVKYVEAGWLGRKTGRGFYDYHGEKPVPTR